MVGKTLDSASHRSEGSSCNANFADLLRNRVDEIFPRHRVPRETALGRFFHVRGTRHAVRHLTDQRDAAFRTGAGAAAESGICRIAAEWPCR